MTQKKVVRNIVRWLSHPSFCIYDQHCHMMQSLSGKRRAPARANPRWFASPAHLKGLPAFSGSFQRCRSAPKFNNFFFGRTSCDAQKKKKNTAALRNAIYPSTSAFMKKTRKPRIKTDEKPLWIKLIQILILPWSIKRHF